MFSTKYGGFDYLVQQGTTLVSFPRPLSELSSSVFTRFFQTFPASSLSSLFLFKTELFETLQLYLIMFNVQLQLCLLFGKAVKGKQYGSF